MEVHEYLKKTDTKFAIMGVITTGCRSGYAIKQMMDQSLKHFWKISYGQIYPTLKQLVEEGLATVQETTQEGKPDKREYFLTEKGMKELKEWLQEPIHDIPTEKNEILLKIFFSRHQSKEQSIAILKDYQEKLMNRFNIYCTIEKQILDYNVNEPDVTYWLFTLDYGKKVTAAAVEWCKETVKKLRD